MFDIFDAWIDADQGHHRRHNRKQREARALIAEGQEIFNFRENANGGTCSGCHNSPNVGTRSVYQLFDIGIVDKDDPELPRVMLDREAFRQALLNLIINAKQAMPDGGQLVVRTATQVDTVVVYLIDTGCGMDDRTASRMFEAFFSTKPGGSGLGLPTTQKIIDGHGGRINVQSELGRGTQITIELPVPARLAGE